MKNKILIGINILLVIVIIILLVIILKKPTKENTSIITDKEKEHYNTIYKKMSAYYEIMFKHISLPDDIKHNNVQISLGSLEREGFPIEEFVNYDTNEPCDTARSYAIRKLVDNKYKIEVYYKCGSVANYNFTETNKSTN